MGLGRNKNNIKSSYKISKSENMSAKKEDRRLLMEASRETGALDPAGSSPTVSRPQPMLEKLRRKRPVFVLESTPPAHQPTTRLPES
jgi:transposase